MSKLPTHQEIRDMVHRLRSDAIVRGEPTDAKDVAAALIHGGPTPPMLVIEACKHYAPDVAAAVYVSRLNAERQLLLSINHRPVVLSRLERLRREIEEREEVEELDICADHIDWLLDEYDAVKFPNQVPEPRRQAALARLREAGFLQEDK